MCNFITEDSDLVGHIVSALSIVYKDISRLLIYPVFTLLFFLMLAAVIALSIFTVKKYLQCDILLSAKLCGLTILSFFVLIDVYLIAFGKPDVFILFLKIQKDIFFISIACFIGLWAGKIYFKGSSRDDLLP